MTSVFLVMCPSVTGDGALDVVCVFGSMAAAEQFIDTATGCARRGCAEGRRLLDVEQADERAKAECSVCEEPKAIGSLCECDGWDWSVGDNALAPIADELCAAGLSGFQGLNSLLSEYGIYEEGGDLEHWGPTLRVQEELVFRDASDVGERGPFPERRRPFWDELDERIREREAGDRTEDTP